MKKYYSPIKLVITGFVANAKWQKEPGFWHDASFTCIMSLRQT